MVPTRATRLRTKRYRAYLVLKRGELSAGSDLEVPIVEVGVVEASSMEATPACWQGAHFDRLALGYDGSERLHLDEAVAEVLNGHLQLWDDPVHAEVGSPELDHPARVVPIVGHQDRHVMSGHRRGRVESQLAPLLWAPPLERMWIEDGSTAAVEQRHDQADHIAEVVECRWIAQLSAKHETLLAR